MNDTDMFRNALSIIEGMLDHHDLQQAEIRTAKVALKEEQDKSKLARPDDNHSKQLLVNATGEVASLKKKCEFLVGSLNAYANDLDDERKMRADAEHAYKETEALREDLERRLGDIRAYATRNLAPLHQQAISNISLSSTLQGLLDQ